MSEVKIPAVGSIGWVDLTVADAPGCATSTRPSPAGRYRKCRWLKKWN